MDEKECTCGGHDIGVITHTSDCAIWEEPKCAYCGGKLEDPEQVQYEGEKRRVCGGCYRTQFK